MAGMQLRKNRTTNNPGLVDLPNPRRPSSDVAAEKAKKKESAVARANRKHEREAEVARVEAQIKIAQKEARPSGRGLNRIKMTFPAPEVEAEQVGLC